MRPRWRDVTDRVQNRIRELSPGKPPAERTEHCGAGRLPASRSSDRLVLLLVHHPQPQPVDDRLADLSVGPTRLFEILAPVLILRGPVSKTLSMTIKATRSLPLAALKGK